MQDGSDGAHVADARTVSLSPPMARRYRSKFTFDLDRHRQ
jgi:hypothetical protein